MKNCPFCNSDKIGFIVSYLSRAIKCGVCGATGPWARATKEEDGLNFYGDSDDYLKAIRRIDSEARTLWDRRLRVSESADKIVEAIKESR